MYTCVLIGHERHSVRGWRHSQAKTQEMRGNANKEMSEAQVMRSYKVRVIQGINAIFSFVALGFLLHFGWFLAGCAIELMRNWL